MLRSAVTERSSEPLPWQEAYDENGVDRSLVRYALRQTPTERLRAWQSFVDMVNSVRRLERPIKSTTTEDDGPGLR